MEIEREERNGSGYQEKQEFITGIYYECERLMFATARRYTDDRNRAGGRGTGKPEKAD